LSRALQPNPRSPPPPAEEERGGGLNLDEVHLLFSGGREVLSEQFAFWYNLD